MEFKNFAMSIVVPISYDNKVMQEMMENPEKKEEFYTLWKPYQYNNKNGWWTDEGAELFVDNETSKIKCYEMNQDNAIRTRLGLYQNRNALYQLKNNQATKVFFRIHDIRLWLLQENVAFIEINILTNEIDSDGIYSLQEYLVKKIERKKESEIVHYVEGKVQDKESNIVLSLKELIRNICQKMQGYIAAEIEDKFFKETCTLGYSLSECEWEEKDELLSFFKKFCDMEKTQNFEKNNYYFTDNNMRKNKVHWGISERNLILLADTENSFANIGKDGAKGLYHSVYHNYMILFVYYISEMICRGGADEEDSALARWKKYKRLRKNYSEHEQVREIFDKYLIECLKLNKIEDAKVPMREDVEEHDYIFISYSHSEFSKVYSDLADLYELGVNYWYDSGLEHDAGEAWTKVVHNHIRNPRCAGVIFYMSEQLFLSDSIFKEIKIASGMPEDGIDASPKRYFSVNLTDKDVPVLILKSALNLIDDKNLKNGSYMSRVHVISKAFPDENTFISYHPDNHIDKIMENLKKHYKTVLQ